MPQGAWTMVCCGAKQFVCTKSYRAYQVSTLAEANTVDRAGNVPCDDLIADTSPTGYAASLHTIAVNPLIGQSENWLEPQTPPIDSVDNAGWCWKWSGCRCSGPCKHVRPVDCHMVLFFIPGDCLLYPSDRVTLPCIAAATQVVKTR